MTDTTPQISATDTHSGALSAASREFVILMTERNALAAAHLEAEARILELEYLLAVLTHPDRLHELEPRPRPSAMAADRTPPPPSQPQQERVAPHLSAVAVSRQRPTVGPGGPAPVPPPGWGAT